MYDMAIQNEPYAGLLIVLREEKAPELARHWRKSGRTTILGAVVSVQLFLPTSPPEGYLTCFSPLTMWFNEIVTVCYYA